MGDRQPYAKRDGCGFTTFPILTLFFFSLVGMSFDLELFTKPVRVGKENPNPKPHVKKG